jgi:glutamine amidotransferase
VAPRVVVLDHGSGNLRSAERALSRVGADVTVSADPRAAREADGLVVPGVGAFAACMQGLGRVGAVEIVCGRASAGRPVLGICVGMQVLFDAGLEHGVDTAGIGALPGTVERLDAPVLPHMGWNTVHSAPGSTLFAGVEHERFYFVHSYGVRHWPAAAEPRTGSARVSWAEHGAPFVAAVEVGALAATQFHPEKSGAAGARMLANWVGTL